jgi:hypothetical protein
VFGFAVVGSGVILMLENTTRMKMQSGPLAAIAVGLIIAAAGVVWHLQTARTAKPVAPAPLPSVTPLAPPTPQDQTQTLAGAAGGGSASPAPEARSPAAAADKASAVPPQPLPQSQELTKPPALPTYADMADAELRSATTDLAGKMRAFEQGYDARRYQIFDKQTENQQERDQQIQELKTLQSDKVAEFTKEILPQAQALHEALLQRLQRYGISDVAMPAPPAGTTMAMGRRLLQVDVTDVGLLGHQPVQGLAAYLELLAGRLPG